MATTKLGEVGSIKEIRFPLGRKMWRKAIIVTENGYETVPGSLYEIGDVPENIANTEFSLAGITGRCCNAT